MTDEQINAAIAEACGWTDAPIIDGMYGQTSVPNYCTDLNAMHEAERTLKAEHRGRYIHYLEGWDRDLNYEWNIATANAYQRAEAFLRTLGKWEATTEESSAVQKEVQK